MQNDVISSVWPEWHVVRRISRGPYGVVYEAVRMDHSAESHAAVKVVSIPQDEAEVESLRSSGLTMDASRTCLKEVVNDFVNEIQIMESFKGCRNIVSVEDYKVVEKTDTTGWDIYIRMELLTPLNNYISDKVIPEKEVIKLGCDICSALEQCAKRNIIHRDIKPDNIFVNEFGDYKLGDFGIARKLENVTGGLSQKGTYNYMAPEVEKGNNYDATADIYSLGIVLYWLMNRKRLPFLNVDQQLISPSDLKTANSRRLNGEPLPPPCDASADFAEVILIACNADPQERFASATAMKNALELVADKTEASTGDKWNTLESMNETVSVNHAAYSAEQNPMEPAYNTPYSDNRNDGYDDVPYGNSRNDGYDDVPYGNSRDYGYNDVPYGNNRDYGYEAELNQESYPSEPRNVGSFGEKKKSGLPVILAIIAALAAAAVLAVVFVPGLLNKENGGESAMESTAQASEDENEDSDSIYSDSDQKQITKDIKEAELLAEEGDYEGALRKIKSSLAVYPKSVKLQEKETEFTDLLEEKAQIASILEKAQKLAEKGDLEMAITTLDTGLITYPDTQELLDMKDTYEEMLEEAKNEPVPTEIPAESEPVPTSGAVQNEPVPTAAPSQSEPVYTEPAAEEVPIATPEPQTSGPVAVFHPVRSDGINIRALPQHESALVAEVPAGTNLYYYGEVGEGYGSDGLWHTWYRVTIDNGLVGWVRSDLVY